MGIIIVDVTGSSLGSFSSSLKSGSRINTCNCGSTIIIIISSSTKSFRNSIGKLSGVAVVALPSVLVEITNL